MTKKSASNASSPATSVDNSSTVGRFVCSMCSKVYRSGAGLRYHKRKRHRGKLTMSEKCITILSRIANHKKTIKDKNELHFNR